MSVPQKLPLWKNFDDIISCDLWSRLSLIKNFGYANELEIPQKIFLKAFLFLGERLHLCPRSLALASSIPALGLERFCPRKGCPWPWPRIFFCVLGLEPCVLDSTSVSYNVLKTTVVYCEVST